MALTKVIKVENINRTNRFYPLFQELVRLHGGTISVQSTTVTESADGSHGTIFTVTIPRGNDHISLAHLENGDLTAGTLQRAYARGIIDEAAQCVHLCRSSGNSVLTKCIEDGERRKR